MKLCPHCLVNPGVRRVERMTAGYIISWACAPCQAKVDRWLRSFVDAARMERLAA